jgi:hypothetical protein
MRRFVQMQEKVQVPVNGHLVEMQRIKIMRIEGGNGAASLLQNGVQRFAPRPLNNLTPPRPAMLRPNMPQRVSFEAAREEPRGLRPLGQVFSSETGQFCEWVQGKLQPLGEVVVDSEGRLYERLGEIPIAYQPAGANGASNGRHTTERTAPTGNGAKPIARPSPNRPPVYRPPNAPAYEKLFADPGLHLQLPCGVLREELGPLLAHAEQMHEEELLDCHLQIYQLRMPVAPAQIAAAELGDARWAWRFRPLTQAKAEAWGIPEIFIGEPARSETNRVVRTQRLYLITPAADLVQPDAEKPQSLEEPELAHAGNGAVETPSQSPRHGLKDLFRNLKR